MKSPGRNLRSDIHGVAEAQPGHSMLRAWGEGRRMGEALKVPREAQAQGEGEARGTTKGEWQELEFTKNRW